MTDIQFLEEIVKTYKLSDSEPFKIYMEGEQISVRFNAVIYSGKSLKEIVDVIKECFAEFFLADIQRTNKISEKSNASNNSLS